MFALFASSVTAQILGDLDQRSLKKKIDSTNTAPIVVSIENDGKLSFQSHLYTTGEIKNPLDEFMDTRSPEIRLITVRANTDTQFSKLVEIMKIGRELELDDFSFATSESGVLNAAKLKIVLDEPAGREPRPGGSFLRVDISDNGALSFNGTPSTANEIATRLKIIFADRTRRKIYVIGGKEIEKSVFIKPTLTTKLSDVLSVIELLKAAGTTPIGVQIDWLKP